jgi:hypothetical protein
MFHFFKDFDNTGTGTLYRFGKLTKSKTYLIFNTLPSFLVVSCENCILGAQNLQNPPNRVRMFFL